MSPRRRVIIPSILLFTVGSLLIAGVILAWNAHGAARRSTAFGRLSQMRVALLTYEEQHGTLPPLRLLDDLGKPLHSWRTLILPFLNFELPEQIDLSQPWNSDHNRAIINKIPPKEWIGFARDQAQEQAPISTHILGFIGDGSIWNENSGTPKGTMADNPHAILLVSIPESTIGPLEPADITENEVRKLVANGHEVLFIMAGGGHTYGTVTIEESELAFHTWQEVLDQRGDKG